MDLYFIRKFSEKNICVVEAVSCMGVNLLQYLWQSEVRLYGKFILL